MAAGFKDFNEIQTKSEIHLKLSKRMDNTDLTNTPDPKDETE